VLHDDLLIIFPSVFKTAFRLVLDILSLVMTLLCQNIYIMFKKYLIVGNHS